MKLKSFHVWNYKNIDDSNEIKIEPDVTCFVGKNEAGKTALFQALYRLNPVTQAMYDVVKDYPRKRLVQYQRDFEAGKQKSANVVRVFFELDNQDIALISEKYGDCVEPKTMVSLTVNYEGRKFVSLNVDEKRWVKHYTSNSNLSGVAAQKAKATNSLQSLIVALKECDDDDEAIECLDVIEKISKNGLSVEIWSECLKRHAPKIFFFDDYRIMKGEAILGHIDQSEDEGIETLNDLLDLAGITPDELEDDANYEHHKAKLEAIANEITDDVFHYWKQNSSLEVEFDVHRSDMHNSQRVFHVRIKNNKHRVTVPFDERSRGFVWFFSFLTAFKKLSEDNEQMIVLLDEPGLNLHASAQADLLRFIDDVLAPYHQVLYTTHSPFMIDANQLDRVRIVEDIDNQGVKVSSEYLSADDNTVFPLQAALGYSLAQTLFLGPNCLLVEGPSDLLYLQTMSTILSDSERESLNEKWVITPVGGADKLATFVSLIRANQLNICVLMDVSTQNTQRVENLVNKHFLNSKNIIQLNEFVHGNEADIEDLFTVEEYLSVVKTAYPYTKKGLSADSLNKMPRIVKRVEQYFSDNFPQNNFNHFAPARIGLIELGKNIAISPETIGRFEKLFKTINLRLS